MTLGSRARSLLATAFALLIVASPLRVLWAQPSRGWLTPFVLWGALALLGYWATRPDENKA
jgi:hypothetical protein